MYVLYSIGKSEISLRKNQQLTIGKLLHVNTDSKGSKSFEYVYLVDQEWLKGTDPVSSEWPPYHREGAGILDAYYPVEYDKTDVEYSKILITKKPLTEEQKKSILKG